LSAPPRAARPWLLLLALVAVAAAVGGCGGAGGAPRATGSPAPLSRLTSQEWGFSLQYPAGFVRVEPPVDTLDDPGLLYQLLLADPAGAKRGETALDVLSVSVRRMRPAAKTGDLRKHRDDFEAMALQLIGRPEGLRLAGPLRLGTLGKQAALRAEYAYRVAGEDVAAVAYLVPVGRRAYWVTAQASRATWDTAGRRIGAAMGSFIIQ
jgi:hypothetical protein